MTEEPQLHRNVFAEGLDSYLLGLARSECPYPLNSADRATWLDG